MASNITSIIQGVKTYAVGYLENTRNAGRNQVFLSGDLILFFLEARWDRLDQWAPCLYLPETGKMSIAILFCGFTPYTQTLVFIWGFLFMLVCNVVYYLCFVLCNISLWLSFLEVSLCLFLKALFYFNVIQKRNKKLSLKGIQFVRTNRDDIFTEEQVTWWLVLRIKNQN